MVDRDPVRPDSVTSKSYIRGWEWKKGGCQNSTMTPNARKEGSIFYISMKSLFKKGSKIYNSKKYRGQNSTNAGGPERRGSKIYDSEKILVRMRSKFYLSLQKNGKRKGQNSTSLKMGVKILHRWKIGVKILQCLKKRGVVNILHSTHKGGVKILHRLKKKGGGVVVKRAEPTHYPKHSKYIGHNTCHLKTTDSDPWSV